MKEWMGNWVSVTLQAEPTTNFADFDPKFSDLIEFTGDVFFFLSFQGAKGKIFTCGKTHDSCNKNVKLPSIGNYSTWYALWYNYHYKLYYHLQRKRTLFCSSFSTMLVIFLANCINEYSHPLSSFSKWLFSHHSVLWVLGCILRKHGCLLPHWTNKWIWCWSMWTVILTLGTLSKLITLLGCAVIMI